LGFAEPAPTPKKNADGKKKLLAMGKRGKGKASRKEGEAAMTITHHTRRIANSVIVGMGYHTW